MVVERGPNAQAMVLVVVRVRPGRVASARTCVMAPQWPRKYQTLAGAKPLELGIWTQPSPGRRGAANERVEPRQRGGLRAALRGGVVVSRRIFCPSVRRQPKICSAGNIRNPYLSVHENRDN